MTPTRRRRLILVLGILAGVSIAGALALNAFRRNVTFFFDPTQVAQGEVAAGQAFRLGRHGDAGQPGARPGQPRGALRRHRLQSQRPGELHRRAAGPVPRRRRASWRTGAWMPPAPSSPMRCSPSTTRSTCRRRWRARSSAATGNRAPTRPMPLPHQHHRRQRRRPSQAPEHAARTRSFRADPGAAAGGCCRRSSASQVRRSDASAGAAR